MHGHTCSLLAVQPHLWTDVHSKRRLSLLLPRRWTEVDGRGDIGDVPLRAFIEIDDSRRRPLYDRLSLALRSLAFVYTQHKGIMHLHRHMCTTHIICMPTQANPRSINGDDRSASPAGR